MWCGVYMYIYTSYIYVVWCVYVYIYKLYICMWCGVYMYIYIYILIQLQYFNNFFGNVFFNNIY